MDDSDDNYSCFPVETLKGFTLIDLGQVVYCKSDGNYTILKMINEKDDILSSYALGVWEKRLLSKKFYRISKFYIINKNHVKDYVRGKDGTVILDNNKELTVSRIYKHDFCAFMGYKRGEFQKKPVNVEVPPDSCRDKVYRSEAEIPVFIGNIKSNSPASNINIF